MDRYLYRLIGLIIIGLAVYFFRIQFIEHMTDRQMEKVARIQAESQKKIRQKQLADNLRKEQERLEAERRLEKVRAEHEFDKAFYAWYKEPDGCDQWQSDRHMVDCVQHKMTAKSEFRKIYKRD